MDKYGVKSTHEALKNKLINYIKTVYLGQNKALREACSDELQTCEVLYQEPFIESNSAYEICRNGIENSKIPEIAKKALLKMKNNGLGVFENPYQHQIEALEQFYQGKDLFVATGTGSGKTECFLWPMISSLVVEASHSPETWKQRGVRALLLYPMNALVSDQLGRLRKMIGDHDGKFQDVFMSFAEDARIPQFGMYTGRTPYPGQQDISQDKILASTFKKDLLNREAATQQKLVEIGKYPSKMDFKVFVENLQNGKHITDDCDAELLTRQEMQNKCPDILITNYSMLEYMLLRPIEQSIWKDTQEWLKMSDDNKLLFIIDEAHMYRGSSGGEVALLIRRFMHKLGVDRNKVKFILTSASIPSAGKNEVINFAAKISAKNIDQEAFELITGRKEIIDISKARDINPQKFKMFDIDKLQTEGRDRLEAIYNFSELAGLDTSKCSFDDEPQVAQWLYTQLSQLAPMLRIMQTCRGNATKFDELARSTFPNSPEDIAQKATSVFLAIAPLAKSIEGQVLFPARLHMMFRGLQGLYACSNPNCSNNTGKKVGLDIGKVYLGIHNDICQCGSKIYELLNDRACGALFFRGYIDTVETSNRFVWSKPGEQFEVSLKEVVFYIVPHDGSFEAASKDIEVGWLNSATGRLFLDDNHANEPEYIRVAYCTKEQEGHPGILLFGTCPKCKKQHLKATDFITKGNEPFFNLVSEQLYIQPPTIFDPELLEKTPNGGRKVLLFSDSRQRAAILAKDLTRAADEDAMKKALTVSAVELQTWAEKTGQHPTMDLLYIAFLKVAYENRLRFFYGQDEIGLKEAIDTMSSLYKRKRGDIDYRGRKSKFTPVPGLYYEQLLKQMCSNFRSLTDIGVCWLEPCDEDDMDEIQELFKINRINMSWEEFVSFFSAWCMEIMTDSYALGGEIDDEIRRNITNINRFGIEEKNKLPKRFVKILSANGFDKEQQKIISDALSKFLARGTNSANKYLNIQSIALRYGENHDWYKCPRCSGIFPYTLWGKCAHCGEGEPQIMCESDYEGVNFWRAPVLAAVHGDKHALMTRINTEEHTAQLSHKDQRQKTWSTTEDFEMRFQNVYVDNDRPVDVLSCTTTMEVGIDIGSLVAIGLRNIPPMRENYQQRAGRAGRRSASISSIVTFTDNGPHDSYYFHNPEKIISGEPRIPWIDVDNIKLVTRHLNAVTITEFFSTIGYGADNVGIIEFFKTYYDSFKNYLCYKQFSPAQMDVLVPENLQKGALAYKESLQKELDAINQKTQEFPENYKDDNDVEKKVLDICLEEGLFPTYSFPRNVVGFYIEDGKGAKIEQKPERSLDMAISEYAPGRTIVVNKKTYKSGGIYNFHAKFKQGNYEHPARPYFNSHDYYKLLYFCKNRACNWFGLDLPATGECPFCGAKDIGVQHMLKPWGFSPQNGASIRESEAENELTYAEDPCYSATPRDEDMHTSNTYQNLRYAKRSDQPLIILNKGIKTEGFSVCMDCGAAVPGEDHKELKKINKPYKHPYFDRRCSHPDDKITNAFLGHQFLTDMVVYEIKIDPTKVNIFSEGMWINTAAQTLAEAMVLAAGRLLDIEFNDIKSGYRIRYDAKWVFVDVFLFDSLSSGAGYCASLADLSKDLFEKTRETLISCTSGCESACHECLKHFWNQRIHNKLDRFAGKELLDWCYDGSLPDQFPTEQQKELLKPLEKLVMLDGNLKITSSKNELYVETGKSKRQIYIYPTMWCKTDSRIPHGAIAISEKMILKALPKVYSQILKSI